MRIQSRIKGRKDIHSGITKEINREIEALALTFDCSKSFVTNTLLAHALGIEIEERFYDSRETIGNPPQRKRQINVLDFDYRKFLKRKRI